MEPKCHTLYYDYLSRIKLPAEREIILEKVPKKILALHNRLVDIGWRCFTPNPLKDNEQWVHEFYAILNIVSFLDLSNMIIMIRGKKIGFVAKKVNDI